MCQILVEKVEKYKKCKQKCPLLADFKGKSHEKCEKMRKYLAGVPYFHKQENLKFAQGWPKIEKWDTVSQFCLISVKFWTIYASNFARFWIIYVSKFAQNWANIWHFVKNVGDKDPNLTNFGQKTSMQKLLNFINLSDLWRFYLHINIQFARNLPKTMRPLRQWPRLFVLNMAWKNFVCCKSDMYYVIWETNTYFATHLPKKKKGPQSPNESLLSKTKVFNEWICCDDKCWIYGQEYMKFIHF